MPAFTRSIVFTRDGQHVVTGHDDGDIRMWDVETSRLIRTFKGHTDWVPGLDLSADGQRLASASVDRTAKLWDVTTGKEILSLRGHGWYLNGRRLWNQRSVAN